MRKQLTATIQDEDGCYRAATSGDTFRDPDGNWMVAVPMEVGYEEEPEEYREVLGIPEKISASGCQGQVEVH